MRTKNNELKKSMEAYANNYKGYYAHYLNKYGLRARYTDFSKLAIGVARVIKIAFLKGSKWHEQYSAQRNWINVKDKLPYMDKRLVLDDGVNTKVVLGVTILGVYITDRMIKIGNCWEWEDVFDPIMWMPIPEPPKGCCKCY